jgi:hypothetical protein
MDFFRHWLIGAAAAGALVSAACVLTPPGAGRRVVRIAGALLLLLVIMRMPPQGGVSGGGLKAAGEAPRAELERRLAKAEEAEVRVMKDLIAERTAAYIVSEAGVRGLSLTAEVTVRAETDGTPMPYAVHLRSRTEPNPDAARTLGDWIAGTFGIPAQRQTWAAEVSG